MFNEKFVVSSSDDGTVKLWSAETGEFIRNLLTLESGGRGGNIKRKALNLKKRLFSFILNLRCCMAHKYDQK